MAGAAQVEMCIRPGQEELVCTRSWKGNRVPIPVRCEDCRQGQGTKRDISIFPSNAGDGAVVALLKDQTTNIAEYRERIGPYRK